MFDIGKRIAVGDATLYVSEAGKADGEPIVLLHGGLGSRNDFLPLAKLLMTNYRLIAIDSRGHGRSTLGEVTELTYQLLEQDFTKVLAELRLLNAGIIGYSDGGIAALRLAACGNASPQFVAVFGAHWQMPDFEPTREIYNRITLEKWKTIFHKQISDYEAENPAPDFARLFDVTKAMWLGNDYKSYPGPSVRLITCPLLVIHGDEDFLVSREQAYGLVEQVTGARLLNLPFGSHTIIEDCPEDIISSLKTFITNLNR
ncbi:alpha/beta fold hydrolase [Serratia ureilytica]|uniref:alpha/beta fold hydrolase n=1 Tax=Serratia ureilytica TaxID=300181 RepID=UPI001650EB9A|nr:alpha/beta hydrolase [Serratia ureilytica]